MEFLDQGKSITKCEFLLTYEPMYYNDCTIKNSPLSKRNSRFVENKIENILNNGFSKDEHKLHEELKLVIAWKIGAISHRPSQNNEAVICSGDFDKTLNWEFRRVNAEPMIEFLIQDWDEILLLANEPYKLYERLIRKSSEGFNCVYIITLLHFLTGGKCPIYDQYACRASIAVQAGKCPGENIKDEAFYVDKKNIAQDIDKSWDQYQKYTERIKDIFGDDYCSRRVDRSLFVYGHQFADKEDKVKC